MANVTNSPGHASVAGRWTLGLGIPIPANDKVGVETPILVK